MDPTIHIAERGAETLMGAAVETASTSISTANKAGLFKGKGKIAIIAASTVAVVGLVYGTYKWLSSGSKGECTPKSESNTDKCSDEKKEK